MPTLIHPTSIVHPETQIGAECEIGPYCVIGPQVVLGERCKLHAHVVIEGETTLGPGNEIFPFACLGLRSQDMKWKGGSTRVQIGDHNTFREFVTVHSATLDGGLTQVGSHNHILAYCHLAHDVRLGDHIVMSNVATLAGHVEVGDHAVVGGLAAVHQFCRIGSHAMIGGCSKVVQDVPPYMMADGNPAAVRTINKVGIERNGFGVGTVRTLHAAHRILFRERLTIPNALARIKADLALSPELTRLVDFVRASQRGISK